MKREDLEAMTKAELAEHAEVSGVKLGSLDTKGTMIDKILGEYKGPEKAESGKKLQKDAPDVPLGALYDLKGNRVVAPWYRVTIFATEGDNSDVHLICNGHNVIVKRGIEVKLMEPYVEILRNAVIETVVQDPDTGSRAPSRRLVYPHQAIPL